MDDENTIALKNKVAEMKERLGQMYSQSFADASKSKAFEAEFSLFVKSCEDARAERSASMRLQNTAVLTGLTVMAAASVLSLYLFAAHVLFGMLVFLGFGFIGCGFLFLLLAGEIRVRRTEEFCFALEEYFKEHRWSGETHEKMGLPAMPMWEAFRRQWKGDAFADGPYRGKALYAPFRLAITFIDVMALVYLVMRFAAGQDPIPWPFFIVGALAWLLSVSAQMLLVRTIIFKVDSRLRRGDDNGQRNMEPVGIDFFPGSWITILKLFFLLDVVFPGKPIPPVGSART